jgi:hypothetical protein
LFTKKLLMTRDCIAAEKMRDVAGADYLKF